MDGYLQDNVADLMGSTVVTRMGVPIDLFSLNKVSAREVTQLAVGTPRTNSHACVL